MNNNKFILIAIILFISIIAVPLKLLANISIFTNDGQEIHVESVSFEQNRLNCMSVEDGRGQINIAIDSVVSLMASNGSKLIINQKNGNQIQVSHISINGEMFEYKKFGAIVALGLHTIKTIEFKIPSTANIVNFNVQQTGKVHEKGVDSLIFNGSNNKATQYFPLNRGLVKFKYHFEGENNFIVKLLHENGKHIALLVNDIGICDGSNVISIKEAGNYILDVKADGYWMIELDNHSDGLNISGIKATKLKPKEVFSNIGETKCIGTLEQVVTCLEIANTARKNNDPCSVVRGCEVALTWIEIGEKYCAYDSSKLKDLREMKINIKSIQSKYVKLCGN